MKVDAQADLSAPSADREQLPRVRALSRVARLFRLLCVQIGVFLVIICLLDSFAAIALQVTRAFAPVTSDDFSAGRRFADGYHGAVWTADYYDELGRMRMDWHPYTYWLVAPLSGRYLNIGTNGLRATLRDESRKANCRRRARIFMLGGSTIFGEGVRDGYTIPSQLQKILDESGYCAEVTNFGQEGYVSSQELLFLQEQLRNGNVPDLVIFYDGINDSESALLQGEAGVTYDEFARKKEFDLQNSFEAERRWRIYEIAFVTFAMHSSLGECAKAILDALSPANFRFLKGELVKKGLSPDSATKDLKRLGYDVVRIYLGNHAMAEALAQKFGYQELFYWQPTLFQKNHRTPYEVAAERADDMFRPVIEVVYPQMSRIAAQNGVNDLSEIFRDVSQPTFIDHAHVDEDANTIIAKRLSHDVLKWLEHRAANPKEPPQAG